jgi:hypothetical protein
MGRLLLTLAAPLLLCSCLLTPGRFTSTLDIRADRGFTFTYAGEANLFDPAGAAGEGFAKALEDAGKEENGKQAAAKPAEAAETADTLAKRQAVAEALAREIGYRSVVYLGKDKYRIDYSYSGRLDRSFVFPFNPDASAIIPWLAIEARKDGTARVRASAFGEESGNTPAGAPSDDSPTKDRQGTFTLTTDAALVMQNNEEGTAPGPGTRIVWRITPATKTVPTAVVRFAN